MLGGESLERLEALSAHPDGAGGVALAADDDGAARELDRAVGLPALIAIAVGDPPRISAATQYNAGPRAGEEQAAIEDRIVGGDHHLPGPHDTMPGPHLAGRADVDR